MVSQIDELVNIIKPRKSEFTPADAKDMILRKGYSYDIANEVINKVYGKDAFANAAKTKLKAAKNQGYQHHKISRRTLIIVGIVVLVSILAMLVFSFVFNPSLPAVQDCGADKACFFTAAATCSPAKVTTFKNGSTTELEILGSSNDACVLSMKVSGTSPVKGDMVCSLDGAQLNHYVLHKSLFTADIKKICSGTLVDALS